MDAVITACRAALSRPGAVIVLTGAGVSAESGIPTFRGKEGYWTIGSTEYHPQELATQRAFARMPWDVWAWYLYRRGVCRAAAPNPAHAAIVAWDAALGERFALVTQNVDGLHRRAGSPDARMHEIHGDIDLMRCARECTAARLPIPEAVPAIARGEVVPDAIRAQLRCPSCGEMARPHVLWFDEAYDEPRYHLNTVRALAARAALVVVGGTSAQTNLPWQVVSLAARGGAAIVDINVEDNPFGEIAADSAGVIRAPAGEALPALVHALV
jgi:NAD-dependent deacetylase